MRRFHAAAMAVSITALLSLTAGGASAAPAWRSSVPFTNAVASSPTTGGGYPVPPGSRVPEAGLSRALRGSGGEEHAAT